MTENPHKIIQIGSEVLAHTRIYNVPIFTGRAKSDYLIRDAAKCMEMLRDRMTIKA